MIFAAVLLTVGAIAFTLLVRDRDLPKPEPRTGYEHLEERKARIYEGLRDLQFEYRVGKLSEADYQTTKLGLQAELAAVLAEIDRIKGELPAAPALAVPAADRPAAERPAADRPAAERPAVDLPSRDRQGADSSTTCPHCGAKFPVAMKFCGECGKAIP